MSRIIVKHLPKKISAERLQNLFSAKGQITDLQLKYTKDGVFRQFAFIGFTEAEDAQETITYFNNTYIDSSKIQVEICTNLGDAGKPRAWSKYSVDSSAYQQKHKKEQDDTEKKEKPLQPKITEKVPKKTKDKNQIQVDLEGDQEFQEFLEIHRSHTSKPVWSNDITNTILVKEDSKKAEKDKSGSSTENHVASTVEKGSVPLKQKGISDLEYLKSKIVSQSSNKSSSDESEVDSAQNNARSTQNSKKKVDLGEKKTNKENAKTQVFQDDKFTVKLRGLPYKWKRKHIIEFLQPLKAVSIRLPPRIKGIAYVQLGTEKEMKQVLNKHRGFFDGHRIEVVIYHRKKQVDTQECIKQGTQGAVDNSEPAEDIADSGRIFARNLAYTVTEEAFESLFKPFGEVTEVHLPIDRFTRKAKGFGFVTFLFPEHAIKALAELDGTIFQGRLLHLLPAKNKKEPELETTENASYKQKNLEKLKAQSGSSHNWNTLFLGANAVADTAAEKYNITKAQLLQADTKDSIAVRMALHETELVAETRDFLIQHGVCLDAFSQPAVERSKTVILVKNLPAKTQAEEIHELFAKFGEVSRVVLPPTGITALVEFQVPSEARAAFKKLAYSKFHHVPLYLEWAPADVFRLPPEKPEPKVTEEVRTEVKDDSAKEMGSSDEEENEPEPDATVFVKNLNFNTTDEALKEHFAKCGAIHSVSIATKKDMKNPGKRLSMGYGFIQFLHHKHAQKAIKEMQHCLVDGHALELKFSQRAAQPTVEKMKKKTKNSKQKSTKILVRNIPFEAKKAELQDLFSVFGELKAVRLPKKAPGTGQHRGFGFVDFVTRHDAKRAFKALCHSTHLIGRRLDLEWADTDSDDVNLLRKKTAEHFHEGGLNNPKRAKKADIVKDLLTAPPEDA